MIQNAISFLQPSCAQKPLNEAMNCALKRTGGQAAIAAIVIAGAYFFAKDYGPGIMQKGNALKQSICAIPGQIAQKVEDSVVRPVGALKQSIINRVHQGSVALQNKANALQQGIVAIPGEIEQKLSGYSQFAKAGAVTLGAVMLGSHPVPAVAAGLGVALTKESLSWKHVPTVIGVTTLLNGYYMGTRSLMMGCLDLAGPMYSAIKGNPSSATTNWGALAATYVVRRSWEWISPEYLVLQIPVQRVPWGSAGIWKSFIT